MSASPGTVRIDPNTEQPDPVTQRFTKTVAIAALIFDAENRPQSGVVIDFESTAETPLDPVKATTDTNGRAETTLTVTDRDTPSVMVFGRSGQVVETISVAVEVVGANSLPRASASIIPLIQGQVGSVVTFDGSASSDNDGIITCYQWELDSDNPDLGAPDPLFIQGVTASSFTRTFVNEQTLAVTLRVSDDTGIPCQDVNDTLSGAIEPSGAFSADVFTAQYSLLCNNPPPTAVIAGPNVITATGTASTLTSITLDGSLSFDGETRVDRWVWNCGNGVSPIPVVPGGNGSVVLCRYRLGTYTATLNVTDQGTGVINPNTGTFDCQKSSAEASVQVVIITP
jgi:hypothetical protein